MASEEAGMGTAEGQNATCSSLWSQAPHVNSHGSTRNPKGNTTYDYDWPMQREEAEGGEEPVKGEEIVAKPVWDDWKKWSLFSRCWHAHWPAIGQVKAPLLPKSFKAAVEGKKEAVSPSSSTSKREKKGRGKTCGQSLPPLAPYSTHWLNSRFTVGVTPYDPWTNILESPFKERFDKVKGRSREEEAKTEKRKGRPKGRALHRAKSLVPPPVTGVEGIEARKKRVLLESAAYAASHFLRKLNSRVIAKVENLQENSEEGREEDHGGRQKEEKAERTVGSIIQKIEAAERAVQSSLTKKPLLVDPELLKVPHSWSYEGCAPGLQEGGSILDPPIAIPLFNHLPPC